jgi:hypothetical protein
MFRKVLIIIEDWQLHLYMDTVPGFGWMAGNIPKPVFGAWGRVSDVKAELFVRVHASYIGRELY